MADSGDQHRNSIVVSSANVVAAAAGTDFADMDQGYYTLDHCTNHWWGHKDSEIWPLMLVHMDSMGQRREVVESAFGFAAEHLVVIPAAEFD